MDISSNAGVTVQPLALRAGDKLVDDLPSPPPDCDSPRWQRSVVAVGEDQVVGFATLVLNAATDTYFCDVTVSPAHRRRGIGSHLLSEAQQVADRQRPIVGRVMSPSTGSGLGSQPLRRLFAEHLGGSVLMQCPMPSIDPTSTAGERWIHAQRLPEGFETTPMADVTAAEVRAAWSSYYAWAHQPFGAVKVEALPTEWEIYRPGVDDRMSYLCRDAEGQIVAFSFVSPEVWDGRTFIVAETVRRDQVHGVNVLRATLAASLRAAAERGMTRVEIEGHSTDAHIPQVFHTLPAGPSDPLDIYLFTGL